MKDFEKIEHLLLSKRFEELSPTEAKEVTSYFENATDYNDMRDTLMQVKSTLASDKLLIKPNVELKEKLLQKFDNTYTNHSSTSIGKTKPFYKNIGFQWSAAATIVLLISLSIFGYIQNINSKANDGMAVNYETPAGKDNSNVVFDELVPIEEIDKSKVTTIEPELEKPILSNREKNLPKHVGTTDVSNTTMSIDQPNEGYRSKFYENKNYGTFGTTVGDNTMIPVTNTDAIIGSERIEEDAKLTKNGFYSTTIGVGDKQGEIIQGDANDNRKEEQKMGPLDIPVQSESSINYSTNDQKNITTRDYYWMKGKNKGENKKTNNQVSLGLAQEKRLEADSTQFRLDSLQLDDLLRARQLNLDENK